jgi:hypothetical protein
MVCKFEAVRTTMSTATAGNTQDFTTNAAGFGTPTAAIVLVSKALTDTTVANEGVASVGITDGTNQRTWASDFQNVGTGNTNTKCRGETSEVIYVHNVVGTGTHGRASFASWINDGTNYGLRVTIDTQFNAAYKVAVFLFGGDVQGVVNDYAAPSSGGTTTVSGLPFAPDLIFAIGNRTWNSTNVDVGSVVYGLAARVPSLVNAGFHMGCPDNITTSTCYVAIDNYCGYGGGTLNAESPKQSVTSFTSDGFVITEGAGAAGIPQAYLALHLPNLPLYLGIISTPTSTGNASFTGFGFQPQAYMLLTTMADATATTQVDTRASACGIGIVAGATPTQHAQSLSQKDNVSTQVAKCVSDAAAAEQLGDAGTVLIRAAHNAFLSDGVQLNFTIADGTSRKWVLLGLGSNAKSDPLPRRRAIRHFLGR